MSDDRATRDLLGRFLGWTDAHVDFDGAVADLPPPLRGVRPDGLPHSAWELVEHIRIAQRDILDFCISSDYREREWPDGYWPERPDPPSPEAWDESVTAVRGDLAELRKLALDPSVDLPAPVPNGTGQSYLRELLLVADHTAYHVGQLVLVRRLLGAWPPGR